jgi:hypothetical protein
MKNQKGVPVQFIGIGFGVIVKLDTILTWVIIILGIILAITIIGIPKSDCDVCDFDGQNGKEFFEQYQARCLKDYSINSNNPNLPTINISGEFSVLP